MGETWSYTNTDLVLTDEWVGGFFDGEGCVNASFRLDPRGLNTSVRIEISQADEHILKRIRHFFGVGKVRESKTGGRRRQCWVWRVNKKDEVLEVARRLQLHVRLPRKKRVLELVAEFYRHPPVEREWVVSAIHAQNQGPTTKWLGTDLTS